MYARVETWAEEQVPPLAALAVAIVAVSTSAILVRWSHAPSVVKGFYRVLFTAVLIAPFAVTSHRDELQSLSWRDGAVAAVTGVALAIHFAAWFESLNWTSVAASVTLVQTQPLFVAVGAYLLLGERVTGGMVLGILVAVTGAAAMSLGDVVAGAELADGALTIRWQSVGGGSPESTLYGNALAVVGAVMSAAYVLAGRSLRQRVPLIPYVTVVYVVCAATLLAVAVAGGTSLLGYPPREWLLFAGMAVGPGLLGHTLINWSLAHLESSVVSVSLLGEPIGSTLLALALLSEVPSAATLVGGAVILGGIYVTTRVRAAG